jgi:hypothetical protein
MQSSRGRKLFVFQFLHTSNGSQSACNSDCTSQQFKILEDFALHFSIVARSIHRKWTKCIVCSSVKRLFLYYPKRQLGSPRSSKFCLIQNFPSRQDQWDESLGFQLLQYRCVLRWPSTRDASEVGHFLPYSCSL